MVNLPEQLKRCDKAGCCSNPIARAHSEGSCCTKLVGLGVRLSGVSILHDVNLHVHCGELTAIMGPNGAGKSTLFRAMLGEIPHTGVLKFMDMSSASGPHVSVRIGYVPQKLEFEAASPITVQDLFSGALSRRPLWTGYSKRSRICAIKALEITKAEHLLTRQLGLLSGGELQRVLLALALTPVPHLLLLDEPVSGVDPAGIELFYQMVSALRDRYDMSILLVSHDLHTVARYADRMIFLNKTVLCDGTPAEVLAHELVRKTFGITITEAAGRQER